MSQIVGSSGQIVGVDFSEQRLEQARSCSDVGIEYRHGQGERTPADDNEFDVSWSRFLFEYLLEPENVLSEMIRVTKPGGKIVVSDLDGNCLWHYPVSPEFECDLQSAIKTLRQAGFDPFVGRKLYYYAAKAGLEQIKVDAQPYHFYPGKINEIALEHWEIKLETVVQSLVKLGWKQERAILIKKQFLDVLSDEMSFSYSVLITVQGIKKQ